MRHYTDRNAWRDAAVAAGLTVEAEPSQHEGPHPDDVFTVELALDAAGDVVGMGSNVPVHEHEDSPVEWHGDLATDARAFAQWANDPPQCDEEGL